MMVYDDDEDGEHVECGAYDEDDEYNVDESDVGYEDNDGTFDYGDD